ncbi:MAG: hemerythrin domain-containing protein [Dysgonamonadaceae bacterium]|jgi:regulator of cell morphogenesis and NO signaling|nr:hemerythrin domain-containing protein [Dysgonamonadaceae bacterium]
MNGYKSYKYKPNGSMSVLISENCYALPVLTRFGIALGFGDKSVLEVCRDNCVDVDTFIAVISLTERGGNQREVSGRRVSIESLIDYLYNSHHFFLQFRLPEMRRKLVAALNDGEDDLNLAVIGYFDNFVSTLKKHTQNEDRKLFPYVRALLQGEKPDKQTIVLGKQHERIQSSLTEFKNVLIKYYPSKKANEINSFLFDVFNCERDLASHNAVEELLFKPAIEEMVNNLSKTV